MRYLNVIVTQTTALATQRTAVDILGRQMGATVLLIEPLGGGWDASALNSADARSGGDSSGPQYFEGKATPADVPSVRVSAKK